MSAPEVWVGLGVDPEVRAYTTRGDDGLWVVEHPMLDARSLDDDGLRAVTAEIRDLRATARNYWRASRWSEYLGLYRPPVLLDRLPLLEPYAGTEVVEDWIDRALAAAQHATPALARWVVSRRPTSRRRVWRKDDADRARQICRETIWRAKRPRGRSGLWVADALTTEPIDGRCVVDPASLSPQRVGHVAA